MYIKSKKYGIFEVLIDEDSYEKTKQYTWSIAMIKSGNKKNPRPYCSKLKIFLYRFILEYDENMDIDHINRNTLDNRKENLRVCSRLDNIHNRGDYQRANSSTGIKGLCKYYSKEKGKYYYYVKLKGFKVAKKLHKEDALQYIKECGEGKHVRWENKSRLRYIWLIN